jgi:phosphoglycolate phosphatase
MPPDAPEAILFDWDNTLVDGWEAIHAALNATFRAFAMPEWSRAEVLARVRRSLRESFPQMFGAEWTAARDIFHAEISRRHLDVLRPLPGSLAALDAAAPIPLAIVSNKQGPILRAEARHLGWTPRFAALIGAGDAAADKPDPAPMRAALAALRHEASPRVWYVGDTALDMQAARAAGLRAVLLGDAAHDGGIAACAPDAHFADGHGLAAYLASLDKPAR